MWAHGRLISACASMQSDQSLISALWLVKGPLFLLLENFDSGQTVQMHRLISIFSVSACQLVPYAGSFRNVTSDSVQISLAITIWQYCSFFCYSVLFFSVVNGLLCVAGKSQIIFQFAILMRIFAISWLFVLQTKSISISIKTTMNSSHIWFVKAYQLGPTAWREASKSKWEWPWNATITDHIPSHGTERKRHRILTVTRLN